MDLAQFEQSGREWTPKAHRAKGGWSIRAEGEDLKLYLEDDFATDWGPDVMVYLTREPVTAIGIRDDLDRSGVFVGPVKAFKGAQSYTLPNVADFGRFKALMLHCRSYSAVWCGVPLNQPK